MQICFNIRNIFFLILEIIIINSSLIISEVRYVSKTGSSTPPYTSWATASDSIQKCINISNFGDTIYVANGVYKERVVMISGLSLIGSSMDSCIIDTRGMEELSGFYAVMVSDSTLLRGFRIKVSNLHTLNHYWGFGFYPRLGVLTKNAIIENNRIEFAETGIYTGYMDSITIRKNIITDVGSGMLLSSFIYDAHYFVEDNFISHADIINVSDGILIEHAAKAIVRNNTIIVKEQYPEGILIIFNDQASIIENNLLIYSTNEFNPFGSGIYAENYPTKILNNVIVGPFYGGIGASYNNIVKNNIVTKARRGIEGMNTRVYYNNLWGNQIDLINVVFDSTNLKIDPMFVDTSAWDFHLQKYSPMIDAGDPTILDKDGSRSDIGLYGGPFGKKYQYLDIKPSKPRGIELRSLSKQLVLNWRKNTESDVTGYRVYYDTIANFDIGAEKLLVQTIDTSASVNQLLIGGLKYFYLKVTAIDSAGNESEASQEVFWGITSVTNESEIFPKEYYLYQNHANPFNPSTIIGYRLKQNGYVKLIIYNLQGKVVGVLVNEEQNAGYHEVEFDAGESGTTTLSSGIYIYKLEVIDQNNIPVFTDFKKMILLK